MIQIEVCGPDIFCFHQAKLMSVTKKRKGKNGSQITKLNSMHYNTPAL